MASSDSPVLIITGASSGIGAATARAVAQEGWRVVLGARSRDKLDDLARELGEDTALAVRCDVTEWDQQQALVAAALDRFGRLDAFFANAGFGAARGFTEESVEHWRSMVDTNVYGCALSIRAVLGHFRSEGRGHMVLTGSVAGRKAMPGSLYSATKWAVHAMGEGLRAEVADSEIRATVIAPGKVDTPFFDDPVEDALQPEDIARGVVYALSQPAHVDVNELLIRPVRQPM